MFALTLSGSAMAAGADVVVPDSSGVASGVTGNTAINGIQPNIGPGAVVAHVLGANSHLTVTGTGNANTLSANLLAASATGNSATDLTSLDAIGSGPVTGIGILNLSINIDHFAQALNLGGLVSAELTDFVDGTATVTGNTIESNATLNTATITVTPAAVPLFFPSGSPGKSVFQSPSVPLLHADGDVAAVNGQENFDSGSGSGSFAGALGAVTLAIGQDAASTGDHAVSGASTLSGNSLSSTFAGNNAATSIGAGAGGQPSFAGSLTLDNLQYNLDLATGAVSALTGGLVVASIYGDATGTGSLATETLVSTLIETGNAITSSASGNSALATTGAGNSISVANGVSFVDPDGQTHENSVDIGFGISANTAAGLTLFNGQFNDRDTGPGQVPLVAETAGAVLAQVQNIDGGGLTLTNNSVTSASSGNTATNAIVAGGANSAVIDGTAALTSVQQNTHSAIVAATGKSAVAADVGAAAGNSTVDNSTATVSDNTVGATAYGDSVGNTVSLAGQTISSGDVPGTITRLTADQANTGPSYGADSEGSTLVNVQRMTGSGSLVQADTLGGFVELDAGFDTAATGDNLNVAGNFLQAIAVGNSAGSSIGSTIGAAGGSFAGTLGLLSGQTDSAAVTANLTDAAANLIVTAGGGDVGAAGAGSSVSLSGNVLRALAYDNQVTGNDLAVAVTSLSVEGVTSKGAEIVVAPGDATGRVFDDSSRPAPLVIAGLALLNDQSSTAGAADVTANTTSEDSAVLLSIGNDAGGDLVASTAAANSNAVVSAARGNVAANATSIITQSLSVAPTGFDPVASVTNIQTMIVGSDARAITDTSNTGDPTTATAAIPTVELAIGGGVLGSTASADTNQISAVAEGNTATNTLNVTSGSLVAAWVSKFPLYITGAAYTGPLTNDAAFTVTNAQSSMLDSRGATVVDDGVSVDVGASVSTGTVRADTNQLFAQASDNTATNTLSIAASSFEASASVQSLQLSNTASLFVNQGSDGTGVALSVGGQVLGSTLDASGNTYGATGTSNTATNQVTVAAGYATGAVGPVPLSHQGAFYTAPDYSTATGDLTLQNIQSQSGDTSSTSDAVTSINVVDPADKGGVDAVQASVLTASNNQNQATAQGNQATNGVSLSVTNSTGETAALVSDQDSAASTMFATATGSVLADQLVASSTVTQSGNVNLAQAGLNNVTNSLLAGGAGASLGAGYGDAGGGAAVVGANYGAEADFALANAQSALADSRLDANATFTVGNSDSASSVFGASGSVTSSTVTLAGNSNGAQSTVNRSVNTLTLNPGAAIGANGGAQNTQVLGAPFVTAETSTAYSVTEPNFNGSSISVTGDGSTAQALGNVATNTVSVSAVNATLASPLFLEQGAAALGYAQAVADYALGNAQLSDGEFGSSNRVLFSVATTVPTEGVDVLTAGSAIHVSGNSALSASEANFAANVLTLAVTDATNGGGDTHAATAALYSVQEHVGSAASSSTETIEAIGMVTASTVDMSDNSNLALSVGNDVSNLLEAAASGDFEAAANSWVTDSAQANGITTGDLALSNAQEAESVTTAVASTTIEQSDTLPLTGTTTTRDSAVTLNGNTTFAEADQNRASNTETLNAGAMNGGLGGLSNTQNSAGSVTADVTASISYSEPNATASSFSMNGNSTVAQATGNSANNALNATAGAQFVVSGAPAQTSPNGDTSGQFAVLNTQNNTASISASNTTTMTLALNGPAFAGVVSNSSLSASNNTISAIATANAATNSITLTGGVTGTSSAALSNFQQNSGSVTATITGSSISVTAGNPGGIYGSSLTVANNSIIARATGNSATNIIAVK